MIKSQITLKQLEAFLLVVETGTFRKAAAALGTTQPNISARISALEGSLGVVLMQRDAGSVRLTDIGKSLLQPAQQVVWAGEAFLETAKRTDLIEDRLRLGVTELIACTWLHAFLRAFRRAYPAVKVELQVDLSREIDRSLAGGQLDLAIQTAPFATKAEVAVPLGEYAYQWVATPGLVRDLGEAPEMAALFRQSILTHARHTQASDALLEMADARGLPKHQIVHSNSLATCLPMAVDGMGVAMLPAELVREAVDQGRLAILDPGWHPAALAVFARHNTRRAARIASKAAALAVEVAQGAKG